MPGALGHGRICGAFALYLAPLRTWSDPLLRAPLEASPTEVRAAARREVQAQQARGRQVVDMRLPTPGRSWMRVVTKGEGQLERVWVHPTTDARRPLHSELGDFLYHLHYLQPLPSGILVAGAFGILLTFLVTGGLMLEWRRIRQDLRRPRRGPGRGPLRQTHKLAGLLGLPFLLLMGWTGAHIALRYPALRPLTIQAAFEGDHGRVQAAEGEGPAPAAAGQPGPVPDPAQAVEVASAAVPDATFDRMFFNHFGDLNGSVLVAGEDLNHLALFARVRVDAQGHILSTWPAGGPTPHAQATGVFHGLHYARWAGPGFRALYSLLSLLTAATALSGMLLWLSRSRPAEDRLAPRLMRATIGFSAGLVLAISALFLLNQLVPPNAPNRVAWEQIGFCIAWGLALLGAFVPLTPRRIAGLQLTLAAGLMGAALLLDLWANRRLPFQDPSVAGMDLTLWIWTLLLASGARWLRPRAPAAVSPAAPPG